MIEILTDVPPGVVGVRARGTLTREEYDDVVVPMLDEAHRTGRRLRILCEVGADYTGLTPGAMWEDLRLGTRALLRYARPLGWRGVDQWSAGGRCFVALRSRSTSSRAEPLTAGSVKRRTGVRVSATVPGCSSPAGPSPS